MTQPSAFRALREALPIWLWGWPGWVNRCILWCLCWLTVVLGPPATFALFHAAHYSIHGVELTVRELARTVRAYFWPSWLCMLATLAVGAAAWGIVALTGGALAVRWTAAILILFWLAVQFYALPVFMLQERKSIVRAWKSGLRALVSAPLFSLVTFGVAFAVGLVSLILVAALPMGGPGLVVVLAAQTVFEREKDIEVDEEE